MNRVPAGTEEFVNRALIPRTQNRVSEALIQIPRETIASGDARLGSGYSDGRLHARNANAKRTVAFLPSKRMHFRERFANPFG